MVYATQKRMNTNELQRYSLVRRGTMRFCIVDGKEYIFSQPKKARLSRYNDFMIDEYGNYWGIIYHTGRRGFDLDLIEPINPPESA